MIVTDDEFLQYGCECLTVGASETVVLLKDNVPGVFGQHFDVVGLSTLR